MGSQTLTEENYSLLWTAGSSSKLYADSTMQTLESCDLSWNFEDNMSVRNNALRMDFVEM